jgi:predicted acetyltransferase
MRSLGVDLKFQGAPADPMLALLPECSWRVDRAWSWMLRVLDVPRAFAGRGWPRARGELHLEVRDETLPENAGRWTVEVCDGDAEVLRGGRGELRVDARALAPLYTGYQDAATLRRIGWIEGPDEAIEVAAALFAGPPPWMPDFF